MEMRSVTLLRFVTKYHSFLMFFEVTWVGIIQIVHVIKLLITSPFSSSMILYFNLYPVIKMSFSS